MSRRRYNAKPVVVEAPVASTPAGLPLAPVASPVVVAPALATAEDRIAELELLVEERDATIADLNAALANAHASYEAEIAALKASAAPVAATPAEGIYKRRVTGHCGIRFRGREYHEGDVFPFDPTDPPHDVSGVYVEGIHYRYE